ncbi:4a-hydroxytetrahydrobiopterin dehydratase [Gammaproteobacteria bacterium]|nr:4a-hydroxytetrahydrobiopterin dehydratase [Gammaproteobacteria bacterium]
MASLKSQSCEACQIGAPKVSENEINELLLEIEEWTLIKEPIKKLQKVFNFKNYKDSLNFSNKIAKLADEEDHHPQIILEWGKVTVTWWSHKIEGLHHNDFICAAKTDQLFK